MQIVGADLTLSWVHDNVNLSVQLVPRACVYFARTQSAWIKMHIIIIGSGLAGLTAAIALAKSGHRVQVLESAPKITYIGAGIQVSPNSSRILRRLGVDKFIEKYCTEPVDHRMLRWQDGKLLVQCPLKEPAHEEYGSPYWHIHRADLHRGLLECAEALGVESFFDCRVIDADPNQPSVTTKDGRKWTADLIVASDGLHSTCRNIVLGHDCPPVPTGQMAYRVTLPASRLKGIQGLEDLITTPGNIHWIGPKGTILSYLLEGINDTLVNLVFTCDVELGTMEEGVDQKSGTPHEVLQAFQGWDPRIEFIVQNVDSVLEWRLYTHNAVDHWAHPSKRFCLIGDSAHAMTPYLAQGAAMGVEDAAILGGVLEAYPDPKDLAVSLAIYEKLRIERTSMVAAASIDSRWFTQMEDGPEQEKRDEYLLSHPGIWPNHINIRSRKEFLDELFGYDAYAVLENELEAKKLESRNGGIA